VNLDEAHELIGGHLEGPVAAAEYVQHVEYDPELRRWYVRFTCDGATPRRSISIRTSGRCATRYLPDPPAEPSRFYRYLLRRNA
jgi:hypothetical protein